MDRAEASPRPFTIRGVFLHGPSSSGKTELARALQLTLPEPWLFFDADTALSGYPHHHPRFVPSDNRRWAYAYLIMVRALIEEGFGVIAEQILWTEGHVTDCHAVLGSLPILFVGVFSDPQIAETRETGRSDRAAGTARYHLDNVCWDHEYDLTIDTSSLSPLEAARLVAARVVEGTAPSALSGLAPRCQPSEP